jgi:hypothetical protein
LQFAKAEHIIARESFPQPTASVPAMTTAKSVVLRMASSSAADLPPGASCDAAFVVQDENRKKFIGTLRDDLAPKLGILARQFLARRMLA